MVRNENIITVLGLLNSGTSVKRLLVWYYEVYYQADAELCLCVQFLIGGLYCYTILIYAFLNNLQIAYN